MTKYKIGEKMKTLIFRNSFILLLITVMANVLLSGCSPMSQTIRDETAGLNGSFESVKSGLPVNWLMYTPKTVQTADFDLIIDTTEFKDGRQSLHFAVRECSPDGGWYSPGFCKEFTAIPGESYKLSFWVKNDGCKFFVRIGGVSAHGGEYETVVNSKGKFDTWKQFEYTYKMPTEKEFGRLRFEMNILQPGNFWIDDIKIEDVNGKSVVPASR
jgi:hypothetical protein